VSEIPESDILKALKQIHENMQKPRYKYFASSQDKTLLEMRLGSETDEEYKRRMFQVDTTITYSPFIGRGKVIGIEEERLKPQWDRMPPALHDDVTWSSMIGNYARKFFERSVTPKPRINPNWSMEWDEWRNTGEYQWKWISRLTVWVKARLQR
jgi:hypothetical protein